MFGRVSYLMGAGERGLMEQPKSSEARRFRSSRGQLQASRREGVSVRTILSIDGGGIRAIIPAMLLVEVERRTGMRAAELFHLIAGTSTGGILAIVLTVPDESGRPKYAVQAAVDLFLQHGTEIYQKQWWRQLLPCLFSGVYSPRSLETLLRRYVGEAWLSEAVTGLLVPAWELRTGTAWVFRRAQSITDPQWTDFLLRMVARATSTHPTYFSP